MHELALLAVLPWNPHALKNLFNSHPFIIIIKCKDRVISRNICSGKVCSPSWIILGAPPWINMSVKSSWTTSFACLPMVVHANTNLGHWDYFYIWLDFIFVFYRIWLNVLSFKVVCLCNGLFINASTMEMFSNILVDCWSCEFDGDLTISYTFLFL